MFSRFRYCRRSHDTWHQHVSRDCKTLLHYFARTITLKNLQTFGVNLTLNCSAPFVTTGSMRPNSADGPSNFYDAVRTAIHPDSRERGGMIAFNDHLVSAFYATKTNGNTVTTFLSPDQGFLAQFLSGQPYYFSSPSLPRARHYFNPFNLSYPLPPVVILYGHRA